MANGVQAGFRVHGASAANDQIIFFGLQQTGQGEGE